LLAKRPHLKNEFRRDTTLAQFITLAYNRGLMVYLLMERKWHGDHAWPVGGFFIDDLFRTGRAGRPIYADKQLVVTPTVNPRGLRFAGEIDVTNSDAVTHSLHAGFGEAGDAHLDLTRLSFCDISGIRALVEAALGLGAGRRILLHGQPEQLETVMRVTGWSNMPSLELCSCGGRG
jgi:anti-anti-sigma factor